MSMAGGPRAPIHWHTHDLSEAFSVKLKTMTFCPSLCQWWSEKHSRHYVVDPDTQEPKRLSGSDDDVDAEDDVEADDADVSSDAT